MKMWTIKRLLVLMINLTRKRGENLEFSLSRQNIFKKKKTIQVENDFSDKICVHHRDCIVMNLSM